MRKMLTNIPLKLIASCGLALAMAGPALAIDLGQPEVTKGATELRNVSVVTGADRRQTPAERGRSGHLLPPTVDR